MFTSFQWFYYEYIKYEIELKCLHLGGSSVIFAKNCLGVAYEQDKA